MNTLLAWAISRPTPFDTTDGNGEPVATRARPSVHARTSAGDASESEVGFESGRTIGRSVPAAAARMTASENAPAIPVVPTRIVGWTAPDHGLEPRRRVAR